MNASELVQECFRRTGIHRTDLNVLSEFVAARDSGQLDAMKAINLFWETWKPRVMVTVGNDPIGYTNEELPSLPDELETEILDLLAGLERELRIYYEPDSEGSIDFEAASIYVHMGAASALRHLGRGDYENGTQALEEATRVLEVLDILLPYHMREAITSDDPIEVVLGKSNVSLLGVRSLVFSELSGMRNQVGDYDEALALEAGVMESFQEVIEARALVMDVGLLFLDEQSYRDHVRAKEEWVRVVNQVAGSVTLVDLKPQQAVDAFEGLRRLGKSESWQLVASHCGALAWNNLVQLGESKIVNGDGEEERWYVYWLRAEGWAKAQLSPSDLEEYRRRVDEEASERRLRLCFFGDAWRNMPPKAREALVTVDSLWFSPTHGLRIDSVLNELQVATETICYQYIWEPLQKAKGGQALLEFKSKDAELGRDRKSPTLADYRWVCGRSFFKEFLQGAGVSEEDRRFLIQLLPSALRDLYGSRHPSQHEPEVRIPRQQVEPFVRRFLGIGQLGVLRRLAEIGPKLARR